MPEVYIGTIRRLSRTYSAICQFETGRKGVARMMRALASYGLAKLLGGGFFLAVIIWLIWTALAR